MTLRIAVWLFIACVYSPLSSGQQEQPEAAPRERASGICFKRDPVERLCASTIVNLVVSDGRPATPPTNIDK